jgi:hypothetical protein
MDKFAPNRILVVQCFECKALFAKTYQKTIININDLKECPNRCPNWTDTPLLKIVYDSFLEFK